MRGRPVIDVFTAAEYRALREQEDRAGGYVEQIYTNEDYAKLRRLAAQRPRVRWTPKRTRIRKPKRKQQVPPLPRSLCECGCNKLANPGKRYIQNHHTRANSPTRLSKRAWSSGTLGWHKPFPRINYHLSTEDCWHSVVPPPPTRRAAPAVLVEDTTCPTCHHELTWNGRSYYCEWCDPTKEVWPVSHLTRERIEAEHERHWAPCDVLLPRKRPRNYEESLHALVSPTYTHERIKHWRFEGFNDPVRRT